MPRRGFRVISEVTIQSVTCPGVRLCLDHDVFLSICLLGHHVHTKSVMPIFPLMLKEKLKFVKTFPCCCDVKDLDKQLKEESVVLELVKDDRACNKMIVLAIHEMCTHDFLFSQPSLRPCYSLADCELIMEPTNDFPGVIGPKLEFCTLTTIKETTRPELDCLNDRVCKMDECRRPRRASSPCPPPCPLPCSSPCPTPCPQPCPLPCPSSCNPCYSACVPPCPPSCNPCLSTCPPPCPPSCNPCRSTCPPPCPAPCPPRCSSPVRCKPAMEYGDYSRECDNSLYHPRTTAKDVCRCLNRRYCSPVPRCSSPRVCIEDDSCSTSDDTDDDDCISFNKNKTLSGNLGCRTCCRSPSPRQRYLHIDKSCGRPLSNCSKVRH